MGAVTFTRANSKSGDSDPANQVNKFNFEIDGVLIGGVNQISGLEQEFDLVTYKDGEDGTMHTRPGNLKPGKLVVTKDFSNTSEWSKWFNTGVVGKPDRKSISVIFLAQDLSEAGRVNFFECWASKFKMPDLNSQNSGNAQEVIEISYERSETKFAG